jgi:hypothetical protein
MVVVVVIVEAVDMTIGKDGLSFTIIMVTILISLHRIKRNKKRGKYV